MESRRPMRVDGLAQEDSTVGHRDGRPGKVDAPVPVQNLDRWKTVAVAYESASDRCVP